MRYLELLGRICFAAIFLLSAPQHFTQKDIAVAAAHGVPMAHVLVPIAGVLALLGGLSILLGFYTRIGALLIILFLVPVTLMMHNFWSVTDPALRQMQQINFMKNLCMFGGALVIANFGAGVISLDAWMSSHRHAVGHHDVTVSPA